MSGVYQSFQQQPFQDEEPSDNDNRVSIMCARSYAYNAYDDRVGLVRNAILGTVSISTMIHYDRTHAVRDSLRSKLQETGG